MSSASNERSRFHEGSLLNGFFIGFAVIGVVMLLRGPRLPARKLFGQLNARGQAVVQEVEKRVTADPVADAIEEAKSVALRRKQMLNARLN